MAVPPRLPLHQHPFPIGAIPQCQHIIGGRCSAGGVTSNYWFPKGIGFKKTHGYYGRLGRISSLCLAGTASTSFQAAYAWGFMGIPRSCSIYDVASCQPVCWWSRRCVVVTSLASPPGFSTCGVVSAIPRTLEVTAPMNAVRLEGATASRRPPAVISPCFPCHRSSTCSGTQSSANARKPSRAQERKFDPIEVPKTSRPYSSSFFSAVVAGFAMILAIWAGGAG